MLQNQQVTVLGAGIAGLTVSALLARHGAKVTLVEQAPTIAEVGAGLQISPNGARVLHVMGLGEAVGAIAMRARAVTLLDGETGGRVARLDLERLRPSGDYWLIHRADLIDALAQNAAQAGVALELNRQVSEVRLGDHAPHVVIAGEERHDAPILIGADGLHSRVRAALNGEAVPFFTHQVAWRAVIPGEAGIDSQAQVYLGRGRHLVTYPLRGGSLRNLVAVEQRRKWAEESWSLTEDDPMSLRAAFKDFAPQVRGWLERIERPHLWGLFRHPVAPRWFGNGAAILGDAAHPTLPFLAQGANLALEDAWVLAESLARYPLSQALQRYQSLRETRARKVIDAATSNARNFHLSGIGRAIAHQGLRTVSALAPERLVSRFDWLHGYDVTAAC